MCSILVSGGIYCSMMNYVWAFMIVISFVFAVINGTMEELSSAVLQGAADAVSFCIKLLGTVCLWNGLMEIAKQSGLTAKIERLMSPFLRLLFPRYSKTDAVSPIAANITANLLGLGNAATPMGVQAMQRMKAYSGSVTADSEMIRFVVINSAALTLIPTTVAALRQQMGSEQPMSVMIPIWISGITALIAGLTAERICSTVSKRLTAKKRTVKTGRHTVFSDIISSLRGHKDKLLTIHYKIKSRWRK